MRYPEATPSKRRRNRNRECGFSTVELLMVLALITVMAGMAIIRLSPARQQWQADSAAIEIASQLRRARELAIESRRDVQVQFIGNNQIGLTRLNLPAGAAPTVFPPVPIPNPVVFMLTPGLPDTPDNFGNNGAVEFGGVVGGPPTMMFQSDGTFVDTAGNILNGTVFLGIPNVPTAAHAVTVVGATGRIRTYSGAGAGWTL